MGRGGGRVFFDEQAGKRREDRAAAEGVGEGAESFRGGGIVEDAEGFALLFGDRDHRAVHERDGGAGDAQERAAFLVGEICAPRLHGVGGGEPDTFA